MISSVTKTSTLVNSTNKFVQSKSFATVVSTSTNSNNKTNYYNKTIYNQLRRKRDRKGLVDVEEFESSEVTVYPRSRQGLDYELNWTLNGYSITPSESAYRNPRLPLLFQHSNGITDKNKTLTINHLEKDNSDQIVNYYLDEQLVQKNQSSQLLSIPKYKEILEQVKSHLSESKNIYVHDAAVGSCLSSESTIRAVTNDAPSSLFLKHLLPTTTLVEVSQFKHNLTLYLAPNYSLPQQSQPFNIIDTKRGIAVIIGCPSHENIRNVISSISSASLAKTKQEETVTLSTADIYSNDTNAPLLIFSNDGYLLNKKFESGKIVSQGSIWSVSGLSRLYNSITYNSDSVAQNQFDLIEKFSDKKVNTTVPIKFDKNNYNQPSSIVFMIKDTTGAIPAFAQLTAEQAKDYFVSGFVGGESFVPFFNKGQNTTENIKTAEIFQNLIKLNNTNVYIINASAFTKDAEVDKVLGSIISGKVEKSTSSDVYTTCSPIKVSSAQQKSAEEVKKVVKSFETKLKSKVESLLH